MRWILKRKSVLLQDQKTPNAEKMPFYWIFEQDNDGKMFVNGFPASLQHARNMYALAQRQGYSRIDLSNLSDRDFDAMNWDVDEFLANLQEEYHLTQIESVEEKKRELEISQLFDPLPNFTPDSDYLDDTYNAGDVEEMF